VRKDLTPTERKEEEVLYRQLREKQEESKAAGDDNARWIRKNGKIMNIGRYPPKHQGENKEGE
jgi:ribonuclease D